MDGRIIHQLQANDPACKHVCIKMDGYPTVKSVRSLAQALRGNKHVRLIQWSFYAKYDDLFTLQQPMVHRWDPLLREIESRKILEKIEIIGNPTSDNSDLTALYRDQLFPALQRNKNIKVCALEDVDLSVCADCLVNFIGGATHLRELCFRRCRDRGETAGRGVINAVLRHANITTLELKCCDGDSFVRPVLQGLASPASPSNLTKLVFSHPKHEPTTSDALRQYLQSPSATIRCLELQNFKLEGELQLMFHKVLQGLSVNVMLEEIIFDNCQTEEKSTFLLASCIQSKPNLSTLRFSSCNFEKFEPFVDAILEILTRRESTLRHLELKCFPYLFLSDNAFARWMNALTQNAWLEHLSISVWDHKMKYFEPFFQTLVQSIPTLKIKMFSITISAFRSGPREESALLAAVKANYIVQSVQCVTARTSITDWLSRANQSRLNSYLLRNKKLAAWVENPLRLPSRLWPEAIALARDAGRDTLYCSWRALGVQGDGLKHKGRKRKLPQFYKPM